MTSAQIVPAVVIPLVAWRIYRRVRRNIGRQPLHLRRLKTGAVIFSVITLLIGARVYASLPALGALGGGLVLGIVLAMFGLHLTRFETTNGEKFYTPNTTLGLIVTLIFVGRIVYRLITIFGTSQLDGPPPSLLSSPLTLLTFGLTAGYYIAYYVGVLRRGSQVT